MGHLCYAAILYFSGDRAFTIACASQESPEKAECNPQQKTGEGRLRLSVPAFEREYFYPIAVIEPVLRRSLVR
jgi:hypothetical protein